MTMQRIVHFRAERRRTSCEEVDVDAAIALTEQLAVLSKRVTTIALPELVLGGYAVKPASGAFSMRRHNGEVKLVFQEDAAGIVSAAIDSLEDSVHWLGATVCKIDKNTNMVLTAFDLRGLNLMSAQHSPLSYSDHDSCTQTITASVKAVYVARFPGGKPLKDVLLGALS